MLAGFIRPLLPRALVAFDVDGVLAPIVDRADDARLSDGVADLLADLARTTHVAIVSGRSMRDLRERFEFPPSLHVVGSHGLESDDTGPLVLDPAERRTLGRLAGIAADGVLIAGEGAWMEHKPASVVLHTRLAAPAPAEAAIEQVTRAATEVEGAYVKPGHQVVELLARHTTKGHALLALAERVDRRPVVFLGDDVTDEEAFAMFEEGDVSIRVGPGPSCAGFRLRDTAAVVDLLVHLAGDPVR